MHGPRGAAIESALGCGPAPAVRGLSGERCKRVETLSRFVRSFRGHEGFQAFALAMAVLVAGSLLATHAAAQDTAEAEAASPGRIEFVGRNLFATANGTFHAWQIVDQRLDLAALAQSEVVVEVDLSSVDTGNGRRDEHLRTADFFEVETYPTARVRAHTPRLDGETEAGRPRYAVRYDIDLHGVTRTLEGEAWLESESPPVFEGRFVIDRTDFGIGAAPSRWNPMSIEAEIPIRFRVELEQGLQ